MNCFLYTRPEALALRWLLPFSERFATGYQVHTPWSFSPTAFDQHLQQLQASDCKILICHHPDGLELPDAARQRYASLISKSAETSAVFTLPTFAFDGFWPFLSNDERACMYAPEGGALPSFQFGDDFILSRLARAMPCRQAAREYTDADVSGLVDLDERLASAFQKLEIAEADADIKIGSFVTENIKAKQMFATPNQPGNALSLEISNQILRALGFDEISTSILPTLLPIVRRELPIHPSVGAFHSLDFADESMRYLVDKHNRMTFAEYTRVYACADPYVLFDPVG